MKKVYSNLELAALILAVVQRLDSTGVEPIDLGGPEFDSVPCSRLQLYRVAKRYCNTWGYDYQSVTYRSSRAHYHRPFDTVPEDQKAKFTKPALIKVKT